MTNEKRTAAPLSGDVVVDLSTGIPGGYATKVLADGGAEVIKVEAPAGDPLRRWSASGASIPDDDDGALYQYLAASKRSVVADPGKPEDVAWVCNLVRGADVVVWSPGSPLSEVAALRPQALCRLASHATVVAVTDFGLEGPWAGRPSTEATRQAWGGGTGGRGPVERPPVLVGGRLSEWASGTIAAVATLASRRRTTETGLGQLVDVSMLEVETLVMTMYPVTFASIAGGPMRQHRLSNLPGIHPTKDGFVGFMVVTGQQWLDFCAMLERVDWLDDEALLRFDNRNKRRAELVGHIDDWMRERTTEEVVELAGAFRIPVAAVGNGETLPGFDHFKEQGFFVANPRGGFLQPDVPYILSNGAGRRDFEPAPRLGEHTGWYRSSMPVAKPAPSRRGPQRAPFHDLRVADFSANWAGPIVGHLLAMLGADVIKVESGRRPDALRFNTIKAMTDDDYWEWSPLEHGPNTSKRGVSIDLQGEKGIALARRLIASCDVVLENFSPRVFDNWGFDYDSLKADNPRLIMVRMPAFGLSGPWRDRTGYAQTMEQQAGLAWVTGFEDSSPEIPNGPCDPIAGSHATIALLLALEHRRKTGEGMLVEVPMIGGALNLGAEQVIEYSAYGNRLERIGNRSRTAAPQNTYLSNDVLADGRHDQWVTISVETDDQWDALGLALGSPAWARDPSLSTFGGRRTAHDAIDAELSAWCASRSSDEIVDTLWPAGVPVGKNLLPHEQATIPQLDARGYWETVQHPLTGANVHAGYPAQFSEGPRPGELHRSPPPLLGQHNEEVFTELLGLSGEEIVQLEAEGVIGGTPGGGTAW